ncbi:hypothetical protein JMJ55_19455 [Belnapia sp. T6]|uniref:Tetratricopeptide repeat-containing protein n=1 Tax=Belnapia mucosa TaxID=2804532 RepID=A0ABS1V779_9PROT|nr:hypothetical protein [Belnapia mucosa]MBL6457513.1 hypothetical protein [Belnapia mucosa]
MNTALLHPIPAPDSLSRPEAAPPGGGRPDLALAETLLREGAVPAAQSLLRGLPRVAASRAEGVSLTYAAACLDPEFRQHIAQADTARDRRQWPEAEYGYWRALSLYPLHAGYRVQYGHALKEQGKLPDAEVAYRSALALDPEAAADLRRHIAHVAGLLGHAEAPDPSPRPPAPHPLEEAPWSEDVELAHALLLHRPPQLVEEVLPLLRTAPTRRALLLAVMGREEMARANRDLMLLLAEQDAR